MVPSAPAGNVTTRVGDKNGCESAWVVRESMYSLLALKITPGVLISS